MRNRMLSSLDQALRRSLPRLSATAVLGSLLLSGYASAQTFVELGRTTFGGNDYLLIGLQPTDGAPIGTMNAFQARDAADFFGGWLMTVGSRDEEVTVVEGLRGFRTTNANTGDGDFWIGFTDRSIEEDPLYGVAGASEGNLANNNVAGGWKWGNGEPVVYTNWNQNGTGGFTEPNDSSGEDWAEIWNLDDDPGSLNYLAWNDETDGHTGNFAVVEMEGVPPPLVIEVNPVTGQAFFATTFAAEDIISVTLTDYQARPDGTPFDVAGWEGTNLSARGVDATNPAAVGERWEVIDRSPNQLIESYLLGGSQLDAGERMMLGKLFPSGVSNNVNVAVNYAVNLDYADPERIDSNQVLYGDLNRVPVPVVVVDPDYNNDGLIDGADYTVWRDTLGSTGIGLSADGNGDGVVNQADYGIWKANYGAVAALSTATSVPSPSAGSLLAVAAGLLATLTGRRR